MMRTVKTMRWWMLALLVGCDDGGEAGSPALEVGDAQRQEADAASAADAGADRLDAAQVADFSVDSALPDMAVDAAQAATPPAEPRAYSGGTCPEFAAGRNTFTAGDEERTFDLFLPPDPTGRPLLFMWHPLGSNARQIATFLGAARAAEEHGFVIAVPESLRTQTEWGYFGSPTDDLALFDDLYSCLTSQYGLDRTRTYTIGFSAGALWSSYLVVHRAEYLTAAVILSGGVGVFSRYQTPAYRLPVLLAWGGPTDQYGGVINFQETTYAFRDALRADEHTVVMCGHDGGHVPPPAVAGWGYDFLDAHTVRNGESPVNPETWTLPAICSLAE